MPSPSPASLLVAINGGSPTSGALIVDPEDVLQLVPASTVGWNAAATFYEIIAFPPGWSAPAGWTYDSTRDRYTYCANGSNGTTPPAITMPDATDVTGGLWGKWMFALYVNGGGGVLTDESLAIKLPSDSGVEDVASYERAEWEGPQRRWIGAIQKALRLLDGAIVGGVGGGVSLGSVTPSSVSAAAGSAGTATTAAHADHTHAVTTGTPVSIGTANAAGAGDELARHNHVHALPWSTVTSVFAGASSSLAMNSQKITGLGAPSAGSSDAATTAYVDAAIAATASPTAGNGLLNTSGTWSVKPTSDGSISVTSSGVQVGVLASDTQHGSLGGGTLHDVAVASGANGFMSGVDKQTMDDATASPTALKLVKRGGAGQAAFGWIAPALTGVATAGFLRISSAAQSVISADSATPGTNLPILSIDGSDGILLGSDAVAWVRAQAVTGFGVQSYTGDYLFVVEPTDSRIRVGAGSIADLSVDVYDAFTSVANSYAFTTLGAATGVTPINNTWSGQSAYTGNNLPGGGFTFTVGNGGNSTNVGGNFTINLGAENSGGYSSNTVWSATTAGTFLTLRTVGGVAEFNAPDEARWVVGTGGLTVYNSSGGDEYLIVDPANALLGLTLIDTVEFGSGRTSSPLSPVITQAKLTGTDGDDAPTILIEGAQGQDATGAANNSSGGHIRIRGGAPGTGGSGHAGARGNVFLGAGTASDGSGENVVVVNDAVALPGSPSSGMILYASSGSARIKQHTTPSIGGSRANPEQALKDLITLLATMGFFVDATTT